MTIDCTKTGASTRNKAKAAAARIAETHGFPPCKWMRVEKLKSMPNLCLVVGKVT